jgi:hypothetical protein
MTLDPSISRPEGAMAKPQHDEQMVGHLWNGSLEMDIICI